jgi:hypothetical protein
MSPPIIQDFSAEKMGQPEHDCTSEAVIGRNAVNQRPAWADFAVYSRIYWEPGWRRSADRARLQENSLLRGNLSGKLKILGALRTILEQNTADLQRLIEKFPIKLKREKIS